MTEYNGHPLDCFCDECRGDSEPTEGTVYCYGKVVCSVCGKQHGICVDFNLEGTPTQENEEMINRNQRSDAPQQSRGRSSGGSSKGQRGGLPYLKQENITFDKRTASIIAARTEDDNFKPGQQAVVVKMAFAGNTYLWTLRLDNPNLDILCDAFGDDEEKWVGKEFLLFLETDTFNNKNWMRVEIPSTQSSKKSSRG